jgi:hypothetical protein
LGDGAVDEEEEEEGPEGTYAAGLGADNDSSYKPWSSAVVQWARAVLPHVGLVVLLAVYTLAGTGVFQWAEADNEFEVGSTFQITMMIGLCSDIPEDARQVHGVAK